MREIDSGQFLCPQIRDTGAHAAFDDEGERGEIGKTPGRSCPGKKPIFLKWFPLGA